MEYISAKTLLSHVKHGDNWFGVDYNMNLYRGCCHGCIYCDSRSDCYRIEHFDRVRAKADAVSLLGRELSSKRKKGVVGMGAMSDPYNPFEKELLLTRQALGLIDAHGFGLSIATKGALIARDADVISSIASHSPVIIKITVTTIEKDLERIIEPHAPPASERLSALKALADAGIFCGILLMPVLPFINDTHENALGIADAAAAAGARFVYPAFGVTQRDGQREHFHAALDAHFPDMSARYRQAFSNSYECRSPNHKTLYEAFAERCEALGLLYKMPDIIEAYKKSYAQTQLSMF